MADRHCLVVGGTRGIGLALVRHLLDLGNHFVSVIGRTPNASVESSMLSQYAVDVTDQTALLSSLDLSTQRYGPVSTVVFFQRHRSGPDGFDTAMAVALGATRRTIDHLVARNSFASGGGSNSIVLVSSIADRYVAPEQPLDYHVAKAGLSQLARYYALKLGPIGIRVNCVSPCVVAKDEALEFYNKNQWLVDRCRAFIPLGRMGRPKDIVNAIMFLAGAESSYITGQNIVVDGGLTLRSHESLLRDIPRTE